MWLELQPSPKPRPPALWSHGEVDIDGEENNKTKDKPICEKREGERERGREGEREREGKRSGEREEQVSVNDARKDRQ